MTSKALNIFEHLNFRSYLRERLGAGPRGMQARLAKAVNCQATHVIRVLKDEARFTEDQAFRAAGFLSLKEREFEYFLDLVRLDRLSDPDAKKYLRSVIDTKAKAAQMVKNRVKGSLFDGSVEAQIRYFSSIQPSLIHTATDCPMLQIPIEISKRLCIELSEVREILAFLEEQGLVVAASNGRYVHTGKMLHLPKGSPLQPLFQKLRRHMILNKLDGPQKDGDLHFSMTFATSKPHLRRLRQELLRFIEQMTTDISVEKSEELAMLAFDFFPIA